MSSIISLDVRTAKLLTAAQVINSPYNVLKELLENALDSRANSISIEISANSIEVIQVRDNGHGIAPQDRGICCKRYTTSKLTRVSDLAEVGGRSLGFRGEALFAIAQVSRSMEVTTRVEGESPAVRLTVNQNGEVVEYEELPERRKTASASTGTTVRVNGIFGNLPVRKQAAEKDASKCLAMIRKLLQAYALARPNVRLQMRVLHAKNEKSNFNYAPRTGGASVRDAAWQIAGSEAQSQCLEPFLLQSGSLELQALLPTAEADAKKVSSKGHYISVDRRPLSTARGTLKAIAKLVAQKIKGNSALANVRDPFFVLDISCPTGAYDPNIEPSKDDVLFHDADTILKAVEELLSAAYPREAQSKDSQKHIAGPSFPDGTKDLVLIPSFSPMRDDHDGQPRKVVAETTEGQDCRSKVDGTPLLTEVAAGEDEINVLQSRADIWQSTMNGFDDEDADLFAVARSELIRPNEMQQVDKRDVNPWTIAKMNVSRKVQPGCAQIVDQMGFEEGPGASNQQQPKHRYQILRYSPDQVSGPYGLPTPLPSSSPVRETATQYTNGKYVSPRKREMNKKMNKACQQPFRAQIRPLGPVGEPKIAEPKEPEITAAQLENEFFDHLQSNLVSQKRRRTTEIRRTKTSRLPLERVPDGYETQQLVQIVHLNEENILHANREAELGDSLDKMSDPCIGSLCFRAIELLRKRLHHAELISDEPSRLVCVGTLARLARATEEDTSE